MTMLECLMMLFFLIVLITLLILHMRRVEGFINGSAAGTNAPRCGVEFPAGCPLGTRCVNGYCASVDPPRLPPFSDLPVVPMGYIR